jgi:hypothetical protein
METDHTGRPVAGKAIRMAPAGLQVYSVREPGGFLGVYAANDGVVFALLDCWDHELAAEIAALVK